MDKDDDLDALRRENANKLRRSNLSPRIHFSEESNAGGLVGILGGSNPRDRASAESNGSDTFAAKQLTNFCKHNNLSKKSYNTLKIKKKLNSLGPARGSGGLNRSTRTQRLTPQVSAQENSTANIEIAAQTLGGLTPRERENDGRDTFVLNVFCNST